MPPILKPMRKAAELNDHGVIGEYQLCAHGGLAVSNTNGAALDFVA
jgi:hypothetical protein